MTVYTVIEAVKHNNQKDSLSSESPDLKANSIT